MKNENYITIQGWMVNELLLTGNDLICYALIYGFTQNGGYWEKSQAYISEWLGVSKRSVSDILKRLVDNKHIDKKEYEVNGVKFCKYKANAGNFIGGEESSMGGSEESSLHRNNNNTNKEKEIDLSISKKMFTPPTLSEIASYIQEKNYHFDAESFFAFYESKGWMVGKNKMKNWRMACITWEKGCNKGVSLFDNHEEQNQTINKNIVIGGQIYR